MFYSRLAMAGIIASLDLPLPGLISAQRSGLMCFFTHDEEKEKSYKH
jgi:hypothetical protein